MDSIKVLDKEFVLSIPAEKIAQEVARLGAEISRDFEGQEPIFLAVLNGSFMFAADLLRQITIQCQISFVKMASYEGLKSTGTVREMIGFNEDITGRPVIIIEDIIDSGLTIAHMVEMLQEKHPSSISLCSFFVKPENLKVNLDIKYPAMEIPNDFILGYGLDYDGYGRNLKDIYTLKQ